MPIPEPNPVKVKAHTSPLDAIGFIEDITELHDIHTITASAPDTVKVLRGSGRIRDWISSHRWMVVWIVWLLQFLAIEGAAIRNPREGDTLSENAWVWFSIKAKGKAWRARRLGGFFLLAWLLYHIMSGGWM